MQKRYEYGLSARETVVAVYMSLFREYGWTRKDVDNLEMSYVCDLLVVKDKLENPQEFTYGEVFF